MQVYNYPLFSSPQDMSGTITSPAMQLLNMYGYSIQVEFTGSPVGTFKLQGSTDPIPRTHNSTTFVPTDWTDIAGSSLSVAAAGDCTWNAFDAMYNFVRLVYTPASGSGSLTTAIFNGKGA